MKKLFSVLSFVIVLGGAMAFSNPSYDRHRDVVVSKFVNTEAESKDETLKEKAFTALTSTLGGLAVEQILEVDNYLVLSIGKLKLVGKKEVVTLGVFGNVFYLK